MTINIAISGFGRIGRLVLRAIYESKRTDVKIVAINCSRGDIKSHAHLIKYDTAHGRFEGKVETTSNHFIINGDKIKYLNTRKPEELNWKDYKVDVVFECTGAFRGKSSSYFHIDQGAKKVLISAPGEKDIDATIVYGVNHNILKSTDLVVSNASCTTNGLAPIAKVIQDKIGIESGIMNTIHSYTNDQALLDNMHVDIRRARAAAASMIPSKTGAAAAIGLVIPELMGKLDGIAIRVPTNNVSLVDLTFIPSKKTSKEEVNKIMSDASQGALKDILVCNDEPLVSVDFNHTTASSYFDSTLTKVSMDGDLVKVFAWYDNEWGFSCRMLDTAVAMMNAK
ncbi:type I glyceraldehyde-3-phosphate dehydrogenase [Methylophilaceae bacterium]|jgi:glyceraldehyde 3-phosphate dehydrogenase|nr:type I glyceraldehyde-3-phosphate dehydrogenase [Methylophilaceae bacterium]|tara:strand:- start:2950 stop:3966 length:1017 start_codon:yes stop_codon:yes gene_type:complete